MSSVAAIIPTVGRSTLDRAIKSVLSQTTPINEVIVIDASPQPVSISKSVDDSRIRVVRTYSETDGSPSAAKNRNIGVASASSEFIAFLDDDDEWHPRKTEVQVEALRKARFEDIVISCRSLYRLANGLRYPRPVRLLPDDPPVLRAFYGRPHVMPLLAYTATSTFLMKRTIALDVPMVEDMDVFEDIWWMHKIEEAGYRFVQLPSVLTTVHAQPRRSLSRDSVRLNLDWASQLEGCYARYGRNYVLGIARRNAALLGRKSDFEALNTSLDGRFDKARLGKSLEAALRLVLMIRSRHSA